VTMPPWSCDPARMARWRAIDRERARRSPRTVETATEPTEALPVAAAPTEPRPRRRSYGVAADRGQPAVHRVLGGARGGD
jgi:hypothetical protein